MVGFTHPTLAGGSAPKPAKRLNPVFKIEGERVVMVTQFLSAVPAGVLGRLDGLADEIGVALDMVVVGF